MLQPQIARIFQIESSNAGVLTAAGNPFLPNVVDLLSFFTLSVHRAAKEMQSSRVSVVLNSVVFVLCIGLCFLFFLLYILGIIQVL